MAEYQLECVQKELQDARIKDDDWTGKTDPAERKRRQNRLHQRAWRRRKAQQNASGTENHLVPAYPEQQEQDLAARSQANTAFLWQLVQDHVSGRRRMPVSFELPQSREGFWDALMVLGEARAYFAYMAELYAQRKREITPAFMSPYPLPETTFPLSLDHKLFVLTQHNALRGIMTNMSILLTLKGEPFEGWADFDAEDFVAPENAPPDLQPTPTQRMVGHEAWIDVIPHAGLRDNIIRNLDSINDEELCEDFLGGFVEQNGVENRGMILWGEPWSEDGWEISECFVRKWGFLFRGYKDLLKSTNEWRQSRGERRLVVELPD